MDLSGRNILSAIMLSFAVGWFSNIVGYLPDNEVAYWTKVLIAFFWVIIFLITVDLKEIAFHTMDFFEILAAFFLPFIIAVRISLDISTIMFLMVILVGIVLKGSIRVPDEF